MDASLFITTKKQNHYIFDLNKKDLVLCHPAFKQIAEMAFNGFDFTGIISGTDKPPQELNNISTTEIEYYYKKYLLLKNNGYFGKKRQQLTGKIKPENIVSALANTNQLTFEVTDNCNLNCEYCGYGKYYDGYDKRENKYLNIQAAKNLLRFIIEKKNLNLNKSHNNIFYISFYGGEPLLNVPFIKEIVKYTKKSVFKHNKIRFSMTTNAVLLDKYMDFLVENDFHLLISLDGNKKNNIYRSYKSGKESYPKIYANIKQLQKEYPDYFKNNVNFNAVLHKQNSVEEVYSYFQKEFDKKPSISELNLVGIKPERQNEFWETYKNFEQSISKSVNNKTLNKELFMEVPKIRTQALFIRKMNKSCFNTYNELISDTTKQERTPTGTCLAFSKKIFVTVNGKILPCETIDHKYSLGSVNEKSVSMDYEQIAINYNNYYNKMLKLCNNCYEADLCTQCIFNLNIDSAKVKCYGFTGKKQYSEKISSIFSELEEEHTNYNKIIKEVNFQ